MRWHVWLAAQGWQAAPLAPQAVAVTPARQADEASQQPSQLLALQVFPAIEGVPQVRSLLHSCALGHAMQSVPPLPHAVASEPARQVSVFWSQQPVQLDAVHSEGFGPHAEVTNRIQRGSERLSIRGSYQPFSARRSSRGGRDARDSGTGPVVSGELHPRPACVGLIDELLNEAARERGI